MLYWALFLKGFARMAAYRTATVAGLATNFFFGLLRAYVFIAVFQASGRALIGGYDLRDIVTFTALTQALGTPLGVVNWWRELMLSIRNGQIANDLVKPLHFFGFWLARDLGRVAFQLLFRSLPVMVAYPLFFALSWPSSLTRWGLFLASVALAALVSFCWNFLVNLMAFWVVDAEGIGRFAWLAIAFFSGFLVPTAFFPDWLRFLANCTPLPAIINTPVEVYLGVTTGVPLWQALGGQLAWALGLTLLCQFAFHRGCLKLTVQGG